MSPAYIDEYLIRLVRSHITNELFSQTGPVSGFARNRMQYYLCTRENVPDSFWDQPLETVLKRSTSGLSRVMGEAVSDAFDTIRENSIKQILRPEQRAECRQQIQGRMQKSCDSMKLTVRENITAAYGSLSLGDFRADAADDIERAARDGLPVIFSCEIRLKAAEKKSLRKWYADLADKRKGYEKTLLREKLEKKEKTRSCGEGSCRFTARRYPIWHRSRSL